METRIVDHVQSRMELIELLKRNKLPYEDIVLTNNRFVSYHNETGRIIGSGGLEFYVPYALLRSVAVDESYRGKSIGQKIVKDMLERAKDQSIQEVYLLTETAHDFFLKHGFVDIPRESIPDEVKESSEFKSVCPVSAACMVFKF